MQQETTEPTEYITIAEAARRHGFNDPSALHKAVRLGRLKTERFGPCATVTTDAWIAEYEATLTPDRGGFPRGQARRRRRSS